MTDKQVRRAFKRDEADRAAANIDSLTHEFQDYLNIKSYDKILSSTYGTKMVTAVPPSSSSSSDDPGVSASPDEQGAASNMPLKKRNWNLKKKSSK